MIHTKVSAIGNSAGIIVPKELLVELGLAKVDIVGIEIEAGSLRVVRLDDAFDRATDAGRECFDRYPTPLAELAR